MRSKKKITKLQISRKNKKLQKGGANFSMTNYNQGRLPRYNDVYQPDYHNPFPPNILGGEWYQDGFTADGQQKFRWYWYNDEPLCGDGVGRDDRLWCANKGDAAARDNWCRANGWDCYRCANSGYCTHMGYPDEYDDEYDDESDDEFEVVPEETPEEHFAWVTEDLEKKKEELKKSGTRRKRCNPVPRTCDDVPMEEGKECFGGRCSACENNRAIIDPIDLEMIPTGKGVCIDKKCYNEDTIRDYITNHMPEVPHSRLPYSVNDLNNALQQVICTGSSGPGPSSSSDPGPSSSSGPTSTGFDYYLKQQAEEIIMQFTKITASIDALERNIRIYMNQYRNLEQEIKTFNDKYAHVMLPDQLMEILSPKTRSLDELQKTILDMHNQLDKQKQEKQLLEDNLAAIRIALQDYKGGKKNRKNRRKTKKNRKNRRNTKKYKNKKNKLTRKK